jgi:hypothetical protein
MSRRLALVATAAVAACGGRPASPPAHAAPARVDASVAGAPAPAPAAPPDAAPPRPLDQDLPRLAARAVQLLQAVSAALDASGDDCAAATGRLADVQRAFADVIEANAAVARADRKAELAAALVPQQAALDAAGAAVVHAHAVAACVDHPEFAAALDRALGAGAPPP